MDTRTNDEQVDSRAGLDRMERSTARSEIYGDAEQFADRFRTIRIVQGESWMVALPQPERPTFSEAGNRWRQEMLKR